MAQDFERMNDSVLAKWQRDKDRQEAKAEAMAENLRKGLGQAIKDINVRAGIAKEIQHARFVEGEDGIRRLARAAGGSIDPFYGRNSTIVEGEFTGYSEDRPWERE